MDNIIPLDSPEATALLFHPRKSARTPLPANAQDIDFKIDKTATIYGRIFTADQKAPNILFFHGNGEIVADYDEIGPLYVDQGINFLVVDYRGYGWSDGSPSASAMLRDGHIIFQLLKHWFVDHSYSGPLFIMGRSLGCVNAIDLAAAYNQEIAGLIIESGFAETLPLAKTLGINIEHLRITEEDGFNNMRKIMAVTKPTFILHGQQDQLIPVIQAERLQASCSSRSKELQVMPRADHNSLIIIGGLLYFQTIKRFIDRSTGADDWRKRRKLRKKD